MKRTLFNILVVMLTLAGVLLVWEFRAAALLFLFSLALAAAFRPPIDALARRGLPRGLAILLVYFTVLLGTGALLFLAGGPLLSELQRATDAFATVYTQAQTAWQHGTDLEQAIAANMPPMDALYQAITGDQGAQLARTLFGFASGLADILSKAAIVLVLSLYWNADYIRFERLWLSFLPASQRTRAREIWTGIDEGVGSYVRSEFVQTLLAAVALGLVYWLLHIPYPVLLAVVGGLFWLIPWLGAVLAVIPPIVLSLPQGWQVALSAALVTLVVLGMLEIFVEPRIYNRKRYSSILIVLMVLILSDAYGLAGFVIAPPLAAAIQILFSRLMTSEEIEERANPLAQINLLRQKLHELEQLSAGEEIQSPQVASLVDRLRGLIEESEKAVKTET